MQLGRVTFGIVLCLCLVAVMLINPLATTAQDAGGALPDTLNGKSVLLLMGSAREEGKLIKVQMLGDETYVHLDKGKGSTRYINLRHVTHIVPGS